MTTSPHIHQTDTQWVVIARMRDDKRQILANKKEKYMAFPSEAAALQFMKAEGWTDEAIAETYFLPVEDDE